MNGKLFSFNVRLALMLVAMCGIFAGCYEKEEIDVPTPTPEEATYIVGGIITDAETGAALPEVTVNGTKTGTDGTYKFTTSVGLQKITISKTGYKTVVTSIYVEEVAKGSTRVYTVNAALYSSSTPETPKTKTNKYNIEGSVFDNAGKAIALTDGAVVIPGLNVTVSGNTFKSVDSDANNIEPGVYAAVINMKGYETGYANIVIANAGTVEGEGDNVITSKVQVVLQKIADVEPAKYVIEGNIWNTNGVIVSDATVTISLNSGQNYVVGKDGIEYKNGYYSLTLPTDIVTPTTIATVKINKTGFYPYACSFLVKLVATGETSVTSVNATLKSIADKAPEGDDGSIGGSTSADVVGSGETTTTPPEEAKKEEAVIVDHETGEETKVTVDDIISSMQESTGEEVKVEEVAVTEVKTEINIPLVSDIVKGEGSSSTVVQEEDRIVIPEGTKVIYTKANETGGTTTVAVAENISVSRDVITEKSETAVRTYEGTPSGVIFTTPMQVKFDSPVTVSTGEEPDFCLGVMYYNETTKAWTIDKVGGKRNYATYKEGKFVGNISHFSKFKFGYENGIDTVSIKPILPATFLEKACYTGSAPQLVTIKGSYKGGSMYVDKTPSMATADALKGMKESTITYIADMLTKMIKADNLGVAPLNAYVDTKFSIDKTISAYRQVTGFNLTRTELIKTYTVKVIKADKTEVNVAVTVKSIMSYDLEVRDELNHSGHGHGDDLNAGGGIIDFE